MIVRSAGDVLYDLSWRLDITPATVRAKQSRGEYVDCIGRDGRMIKRAAATSTVAVSVRRNVVWHSAAPEATRL